MTSFLKLFSRIKNRSAFGYGYDFAELMFVIILIIGKINQNRAVKLFLPILCQKERFGNRKEQIKVYLYYTCYIYLRNKLELLKVTNVKKHS